MEKPTGARGCRFSDDFLALSYESRRSNLYCNFLLSCPNSKQTLAYLGVFLIHWEIIFDDWKAREASRHAILRRFSSVLRRPTPFKSLLPFFKFMCRLKINLTVFGSIFTDLRNKFRWLKSPPVHPAGLAQTVKLTVWLSLSQRIHESYELSPAMCTWKSR